MSTQSPIKPLGDRVLVQKPDQVEEKRSGILLPSSTNKDGANVGVVLAVGEGRKTDNGTLIVPAVSVGQKVIFSWGERVEVDGKEYHIVSESGLLGVFES